MRITLDEFLGAMHRARDEERARASSILGEREQKLIQAIGKLREEVKAMESINVIQVIAMLDYLDPRDPVKLEELKKRYPTMFKGGPT